MMGIQDYQGSLSMGGEIMRIGNQVFLKVYNDTGATVNEGDLYWVSFAKDADSLSPSARPTLDVVTSATAAYGNVPRLYCVIQNARFIDQSQTGLSGGIADANWGWAQISGYCEKIKTTGTVTAEDYLQGTTASQAATSDGTTITVDSFGIALTTAASNFCTGWLFGYPVNFTT